MELPKKNEDYRMKEYWDTRYTTEESYDWFTDYSSFKHLIHQDIDTSNSILMLGCGNSSLSEQMYHDGFKNITNTDFSPVVITNMAEKHVTLPEMTWEVMDMTQMSYGSSSFDIVLEKGTIDALLVHEKDPWNTSDESLNLIEKSLEQVSSILKPGGKFISIAFAQPHFRKPLYARSKYDWDIRTETFGEGFHFFYYVMEKGKRLSDIDRENELKHEQRTLDKAKCDKAPVIYMEDDAEEDFILGFESC